MNLKWIAVGVALCLAPLWSGGAMAGLRAYSLPELEEMALKTHPALQVAGAEIKKSEAELRIARQYRYSLSLSQTIEWPGRRGKRQESARFGIDVVNQKLTQEQINVRARCREFFYRVLAGEHLVKIAAENLESAKKLLDIAEKRVRLGESRPIELVKARVEFFSLEREYDKAKTTLAGDRQVLRQFLGAALPADFALSGEGEVIETVVPLKRWQEAAFASHPLLAAQEAQVRQAESTLGAERQAWVPDVTVKVFHTRDVDLRARGVVMAIHSPSLLLYNQPPEHPRSAFHHI